MSELPVRRSSDPQIEGGTSTFVDQVLPVIFVGRNAVGQFFREHTTTLRINCHGCTVRSKHFILKTTPLTLEIPGADAQLPPRPVVGRAVGSRRPEKKGDPFEIDLVFDAPGNFWGIAFPPEDWQQFAVPPLEGELGPAEAAPTEVSHTPAPAVDNVRVFPRPTREEEDQAELPTAPPIGEEIPKFVVRDKGAEAGPAAAVPVEEPAPLPEPWAVAQPSNVAPLLDEAVARALRRLDEASAVAAQKLREQLSAELEQGRNDLARLLEQRSEQARAELRQQMDAVQSAADAKELGRGVAAIEQHTEAAAARLRRAVEESSEQALAAHQARLADIQKQVEAAAVRAQQAVEHSGEAALATCQARLVAVEQRADAAVARAQQEVEQSGKAAVAAHQARLADIEKRAEAAAARVQQAVENSIAAALEAGQARLTSQADALVGTVSERVEHILVAALARSSALGERLEKDLTAKIGALKLDEKLQELVRIQTQIEKQSRDAHGKLETLAAQCVQDAAARIQQGAAGAEKQAQAEIRSLVEKELEGFRNKSTDVTLLTFESLHKSGEWHEKRFQSRIEELLGSGSGQLDKDLRAKAAEVSRLFAADLDRLSRSYTGQTTALAEEATNQLLQRYRSQIETNAVAAEARLREKAAENTAQAVEHLERAVASALEETKARMGELRGAAQAEAERSLAQSRAALEKRVAELAAGAAQQTRDDLTGLRAFVIEEVRVHCQTKLGAWRDMLDKQATVTVEVFRKRLEEAANSCMVVAGATLTQRARLVLNELSHDLDDQVRGVAAEVFTKFAESLRPPSSESAAVQNPDPAVRKDN